MRGGYEVLMYVLTVHMNQQYSQIQDLNLEDAFELCNLWLSVNKKQDDKKGLKFDKDFDPIKTWKK